MTDGKILNKIRKVSSRMGGIRCADRCNNFISIYEKRQRKQYRPKIIASIVVGIVFAFSISSLNTIFSHPFNKGIEFSGGLVVEATCENCNTNQIQKDIAQDTKVVPTIQKSDNNIIIKTAITKNYDKVINDIKSNFQKYNATIVSTDYVSPQMTKTFIEDSFFACVFAFVCIGLYMIIRFNWRFAVAGIIALSVDVLFSVCFINIKGIEFCLLTLTALLTIIGYCINDKIVVFDRIRENLRFEKEKPVFAIIKTSIQEVLFRSILTSTTTIIIALSLLFFGDKFIYEFGLVVIFGIFVGTISSLTFAPSLLLLLKLQHITDNKIEKTPMFYAS